MENDPIKQAMAEFICGRVAEGLTLHQIARELGVSAATVMYRATFSPAAVEKYACAREAAADLFESHVLEEAQLADPVNAAAQRLKVDTLKWIAARRKPKVYGDKMNLEHTGKIETPSVDLTPEQFEIIKSAVLKDI